MTRTAAGFLTLLLCATDAAGTYREKTERFDRDPGWEGVNNRVQTPPREVRQDFGWSRTAHCGRGAGEMGGWVTPAAETAHYALRIPRKTLEEPLTASGVMAVPPGAGHVLVGFFNSGTFKEWRGANTVALRISPRGDVFYAWLEYCTSRWRAGGDNPQGFSTGDPGSSRRTMFAFPAGKPVAWSLRYDPQANGGTGAVFAKIGDREAVCHLDPGHKADGGAFDRFGLMNVSKSVDGGGEIWLDDLTVNGRTETFDRDPAWEGRGNRRTFRSVDVRPRFDFGFSSTAYAGGGRGELGGLVFRGDGRYPDKMASYADPLPAPLTLEKPLRISGRLALRRAVSDSTTLLGFFNSRETLAVSPAQDTGFPDSFFGVAVEGPSSEGFTLYPAYRVGGETRYQSRATANSVLPDGKAHQWSLDYQPAGGGPGRVTVRLDGGSVTLEIPKEHRAAGTRFDRFGLVTTRVDGNGQRIYFDDLTYTVAQ